MDHNPDRLCVWPGYFDARTSRRSGRRVPKDSSVLKPDLEGLDTEGRYLKATKRQIDMFKVARVSLAEAALIQHLKKHPVSSVLRT